MSNRQPILVGVDGSRASSAAIRFAAHEPLRLGAPLRLVHVLAEFVPMAPMHPLLPWDLEDTGRAVLARAVEEVGHLGGTARTLLRHSSCPVVVLPPADEPGPGLDLVLEHDGVLEK